MVTEFLVLAGTFLIGALIVLLGDVVRLQGYVGLGWALYVGGVLSIVWGWFLSPWRFGSKRPGRDPEPPPLPRENNVFSGDDPTVGI